ncbi:FG-GAP-like repeat-containing protein [Pseudomarimonas arenosa]|uniref:VCBS repeat-containing protein n=1 Tax=Pseudomarimonas arenosa TaxID=2774145 RepID=A0AAW3ZPI5_9GAMM|nr:FG-GAP-like repeat-containing protein [Pseudomarimonas arenosa]MBD8527067.1 VCBS repeat-containing protein [Pseudomarimonas arenosa]
MNNLPLKRACLGLCALIPLSAWANDLPFADPVVFSPAESAANSLVAFDYKRDGDQDLYYLADGQAILLQNTQTGFNRVELASGLAQAATLQPAFLRPGMRRPDLLVGIRGQSSSGTKGGLRWLQNDGADVHSSSTIVEFDTSTVVAPVATLDVDRDGRLDIVFSSKRSGSPATYRIAVYLNRGDLNAPSFELGWETTSPGAQGAADILVGDFNRDGWEDFMVAGFDNDRVAWYQNTTSGAGASFTQHQVWTDSLTAALADGPYALGVTDFNRDGAPDLAVAAFHADRVVVIPGSGRGGSFFFDRSRILVGPQTADGAVDLSLHDLDQDGLDEIVVTASAAKQNVVYRYAGSSLLSQTLTATAAGFPIGHALVDTDRDGDLDIVFADFNGGDIKLRSNTATHRSVMYPASGRRALALPAAGYSADFAFADTNSDGQLDYATVTGAGANAYLREMSPELVPNDVVSMGSGGTRLSMESLAFADFDRDGDPDLLAAFSDTVRLVASPNLPAGSYQVLALSGGANNVAAADIDGDGDVDIIESLSTAGIRVRRASSDTPTYDLQTIAISQIAFDMEVADFDRDGDVDVVYSSKAGASADPVQLRLLTNNGSGAFTESSLAVPAGREAGRIELADVDGDQRIDVICGGRNVMKPFWVSGAPGHASSDIDSAALRGNLDVQAADVDADGDLDIFMNESYLDGTSTRYNVVLYEQQLGGGFLRRDVIAGADGLVATKIADINGDGVLDTFNGRNLSGQLLALGESAQVALPASDAVTAPPASSALVALARIEAIHLGRQGNAAAQLQEIGVDLLDVDQQPIALGSIQGSLQSLSIWLDQDGNDSFNPQADQLLGSNNLSQRPLLINAGALIPAEQSNSLFVVAHFTHQAGAEGLAFRLRMDPQDATAAHSEQGTALDILSGTYTSNPIVAVKAAPYFELPASVSVDEYAPAQQELSAGVVARDPDQPQSNLGLLFEVIGGAGQSKFGINPATGKLRLLSPPIVEGQSYSLLIRATDVDGQSATAERTVQIVDGNDPPSPASGTFSIGEYAPNGTALGDIDANDGDGGAPDANITYRLSGEHASTFRIEVNGLIKLQDRTGLREQTSIDLQVITDDGNSSTEGTVTITVLDGDDPPTFTVTGPFIVPVGTPMGALVGQLEWTNDDPGGADIDITIAGGNGAPYYEVNSSNGRITVKDASGLQGPATHTLLLNVEEAGAPTIAFEVTVIVGERQPLIFIGGFED